MICLVEINKDNDILYYKEVGEKPSLEEINHFLEYYYKNVQHHFIPLNQSGIFYLNSGGNAFVDRFGDVVVLLINMDKNNDGFNLIRKRIKRDLILNEMIF